MAMTATLFERKYAIINKSFPSYRDPASKTMVVQMGPEDFHLLEPGALEQWASPANQDYISRRVEGPDGYWGHVKNNEHLSRIIEEGWTEGAAKILDMSYKLREKIPTPMGPRRRLRWQDQGEEIVMDRVYTGQLDTAWRNMPRVRERAPRVISIDADVGHNAHVSAKELFWAGAAAVALTDALEDAGYRVELFASSASQLIQTNRNHVALTRFRAKAASEPLSPAAAAALVALPATFRWHHLMSWLRHPTDVGYGFGQSADVRPVLEAAMMEGIIDGAELVISESLSEAKAVKECTAAIEKLEADQDAAEGSMI